jgi:flagellar biosynthesis GTPase FlhF
MERLRDVLNGTWAGNYTYNSNPAFRPDTRMEITSQISPNTGNLEVNGSGRDRFGAYTLKGSAKSPTEISCVKSFGWMNEWWHTATVDIDGRQMNGRWGPARAPNQVNGTFLFRRQITEADRQREEAAAAQKRAEEARKREEEAAVAAKKKQEEEEEEEEEAAKKKQEEEEAEAARKQKEEAEAAKKRTEEAEAAKKQEEAERARQQAADAEKKQKEAEDKRKEAERSQSMQEAARPRPQDTAPATKQKGKPISSQDSEDDVAGNLKVYLKVDLDADVRVIAALKGDVAVGIL